ncbi:MAG: hypothetical protein FWE43_01955 [Streptococcaceae bacterium]|nr:hypothetical protein [Streptococcaceae bacterium]MCL2681233.1 hypothetical protein [Streptococcaceae bacterium]
MKKTKELWDKSKWFKPLAIVIFVLIIVFLTKFNVLIVFIGFSIITYLILSIVENLPSTTSLSNDNKNMNRTVYVTQNGTSKTYWYDSNAIRPKNNLTKIVTMTEDVAISQGKHHSKIE